MKTTKVSMMVVVALGSLLVCTNLASAQNTNANKEARRERRAVSSQARVEALSKQVNLTDEQKPKVTALFDEEIKQMQSLRAEANGDPAKRQEKLRALRQENDKKLKAILTPEQWEKWQEVRTQFRGRRQNGQAAPSTPKPQKEATKQTQ